MTPEKKKGSPIAIVTIMFLFAMVSFVTNLAAPIGVIWKNQPEFAGSNFLGMLGNTMNFTAYLFMGIPAGKLLSKIGYNNTALIAIAVGLLGIIMQYLSGIVGVGSQLFGLPANFYVYLLGAFIAGFCVCMLNTVINPMMNLLGGGGNKGNQLMQVGGIFSSLFQTLTPMFVGASIGTVTKNTAISDINLILFIAMGVFTGIFILFWMIPIVDPSGEIKNKGTIIYEKSPWAFRHFVLGVIGVFAYIGVEIGIPSTLNFFMEDVNGGNVGATIAGFVAGTYWFLMLVGRFIGSLVGGKISSRIMLGYASGISIVLIVIAMLSPISFKTVMPVFTGSGFAIEQVPFSALLLVLCGLFISIMWGVIFNLATEGLGKYTTAASGIFMMMVVGGGILPLIQNWIADVSTYMISYIVPVIALVYLLYYAIIGSKNVNKDISVDY
jgi:Fucose permease